MDLAGTNTLLAGEHQMDDAEPLAKVNIGVLEDCPDKVREPISPTLTAIRAFPFERHCFERIDPIRAAARAIDAIRPAAAHKVTVTHFLVREGFLPLCDGHLNDLALLLCAGHDGTPYRQEAIYHA